MLSPLKKSQNNTGDINQQLHNTIYKKVTKKEHKHPSPQSEKDRTLKECIELFKKEADPEVLTKLEKSLRERIELEKSPEKQEEYQKHYKYYIKNFLPVLKDEVIKSEALAVSTVFGNGIEQSQRPQTKRGKIVKTILDITNRSSSVSSIPSAVKENIEDQMQLGHIEEQNNTQETPLNVAEKKSGDNKILSNSDVTEEVFEKYSKVVEEEEKQTSKLSSDSESDSGMGSRELSATSTLSEESLNSTLSSTEEDNGLQPEDEGETKLAHLTKTRSKGPSGRRSPSKYNKKIEDQGQSKQTAEEKLKTQENENSDGQEGKISSQVKRELKSNGKESGPALLEEEEPKLEEQKKEAVLSKQEASNNQNNSEDIPLKQPNNRNLHVAFVAGCALSTIGCIVAGAMTSGLIGAGLLAMAAVFAIAAVAELHSNFLSSKLTSINVSPLVDDKELTACSQR